MNGTIVISSNCSHSKCLYRKKWSQVRGHGVNQATGCHILYSSTTLYCTRYYHSMCGWAVQNVATSDLIHTSGRVLELVGINLVIGPFSNECMVSCRRYNLGSWMHVVWVVHKLFWFNLLHPCVQDLLPYTGTHYIAQKQPFGVFCLLMHAWYCADKPGTFCTPGTQPISESSPTSNLGFQSSTDLDLGLVAGIAGSMVVLALVVAVGIVALVIWWR